MPKVEACVRALDTVPRAQILDGGCRTRCWASVNQRRVGTLITRDATA